MTVSFYVLIRLVLKPTITVKKADLKNGWNRWKKHV